MKRIPFLLVIYLLLLPTMTLAQTTCPANVLLAQARAGSACAKLGFNQACFGSGQVSAAVQPSADASFTQPGATADLTTLERISTDSSSAWSVALVNLQANLAGTQGRSVAAMLFGSADLENLVPPLPEITVTATGTVNIRNAPNGEILDRIGVRETLVANGRLATGNWLRVYRPNRGDLGWISTQTVTGNFASLSIVDETTPFYRPFQVFALRTGRDDAPCDGAPNSGMLLQTPNTFEPLTFIVNDVTLRLEGTVFLQAAPTLTINVLDGSTEIDASDTTSFVPTGARWSAGTIEPYAAADLAALPTNSLSFRLRAIPDPVSTDQIAQLTAAHLASLATPAPTEVVPNTACIRTVKADDSLYAGPGLFYEIVNTIHAGRRVHPIYRVTDSDSGEWWQLSNSNWIRAASVESKGNCQAIPVTTYVRPPAFNTLSLETCETNNGPLRIGQFVTIRFVPPGWDTLADALAAPSIDPGHITADAVDLHVWPSDPIRLTETRYIRTFSAQWTAVAGNHRIAGERLSYHPVCTLTVPVG